MTVMSATLSEQLAENVSGISIRHLPDEVVQMAKACITDTVAAALYGSTTPELAKACHAMRMIDDGRAATVIGRGGRFSLSGAALVNGMSAHARELDDFGGCGHTGAAVIPAILAVGEKMDASGTRIIEAVIAAYEVAARAVDAAGGYRFHNDRGWHSTGTCGSLGAAAGVARLLDLGPEVVADAISFAASFTGGLWAFTIDGADSKRLHPGEAASNGVRSGFMAASGLRGPRSILEADWGGFLSTYGSVDGGAEALVAEIDQYAIMRTGFKRFACCRGVDYPVEALLGMMKQAGIVSDQIESISIRCSEREALQLGKRDVVNTLDAQNSLLYCVALAALEGDISVESFDRPEFPDPSVLSFMERIEIISDPLLDSTERPLVTVTSSAGDVHEGRVTSALGGPDRPLSADRLRLKFHKLSSAALPASRASELHDALQTMETLPKAGRLISSLCGIGESPSTK